MAEDHRRRVHRLRRPGRGNCAASRRRRPCCWRCSPRSRSHCSHTACRCKPPATGGRRVRNLRLEQRVIPPGLRHEYWVELSVGQAGQAPFAALLLAPLFGAGLGAIGGGLASRSRSTSNRGATGAGIPSPSAPPVARPPQGLRRRPRQSDRPPQGRVRAGPADQGRARHAGRPRSHHPQPRRPGRAALVGLVSGMRPLSAVGIPNVGGACENGEPNGEGLPAVSSAMRVSESALRPAWRPTAR